MSNKDWENGKKFEVEVLSKAVWENEKSIGIDVKAFHFGVKKTFRTRVFIPKSMINEEGFIQNWLWGKKQEEAIDKFIKLFKGSSNFQFV